MEYSFDTAQSTPLCEIMGRYKSDKGHNNIQDAWHNYTTFYYSVFKDIQGKNLRVFELGLGTNNTSVPSNMGADGVPGASLYGWREFFPNAQVFGADIDKVILFNTDRIQTYFCDQTKPTIIQEMWNEPALKENFDIIIEDGLHEYSANVCFFENSIHKLKPFGYYVIEDILNNDLNRFETKIKEWEIRYSDCLFQLIKLPSTRNQTDNNLLFVYKKA